LFAYKGKNTAERLIHCIEKLQMASRDTLIKHPKIQDITAQYTKEIWYQHFLSLCGEKIPNTIVLVSDFINKVGGIETYLHDVKAILESRGHKVHLRGGYVPKGIWGRLRKYLGLFLAPMNFRSRWKFRKFLKREKPDLIRFHSLLRNLGKNVVQSAKNYKKQKDCTLRMMYHDFGYFYPFPKKLFFVEEVKTPLSFQHFMAGAKKEYLLGKLATIGKYLRMQGLVKILKTSVDLHLVPSDFMVEIVSKSYQLPEKRVKAFHHFMQ
jgi:hypothetical protein